MKILIVEDEKEIADSIEKYFNGEGYVCECVYDYTSANEKIALYDYDCLIVDLTLPDGDGLDLVHKLKSERVDVGIIIISAKDSIRDKIEGLNIGADDYLSKPFHLSELNARLKSIIRRRNFGGQNEFCYHDIKIFPDSRLVFVGQNQVDLTRKEYDLLIYLVMNKNRVLTKEAIIEHLWGDYMGIEADTFDALYTHVSKLRKKLQDQGSKVDYIETVYAVGYKFVLDEV